MKVWVRKEALLDSIHSLPFRAWAQTFNEWVPGEIQNVHGDLSDAAMVYFHPFPGFGRTEALLRPMDINVDAEVCKKLIPGELPMPQYKAVRAALGKSNA